MYTYIHICIYIYICTYICILIFIDTYVYTYMYIYHIYMTFLFHNQHPNARDVIFSQLREILRFHEPRVLVAELFERPVDFIVTGVCATWHDSFICVTSLNKKTLFLLISELYERPIDFLVIGVCATWHDPFIYVTCLAEKTLCVLITFLDGYCSTVQGLLDWFEVDLGFTELSFKDTMCKRHYVYYHQAFCAPYSIPYTARSPNRRDSKWSSEWK